MNRAAVLCSLLGLVLVAQAASLSRRWADRPTPQSGHDRELEAAVQALGSPADPVLVLGDGQRIGYFLGRPTIAVPATAFTARPWDEAKLRQVILRYGVRLVVVAREIDGSAAAGFARSLAVGKLPAWLTPIIETPTARVYALR